MAQKITSGQLLTRQIYTGLLPKIMAFRQLPDIENVPSRAFKTRLAAQQVDGTNIASGLSVPGHIAASFGGNA